MSIRLNQPVSQYPGLRENLQESMERIKGLVFCGFPP